MNNFLDDRGWILRNVWPEQSKRMFVIKGGQAFMGVIVNVLHYVWSLC